jgi:hypothetical protein
LRLFSLISAQQAGTSPFLFSVCTFLPVDHVPIREFGDGGLLLWGELLEDFTLLCDTGVGWGLSLSLFFFLFVSPGFGFSVCGGVLKRGSD